ncbi:Mucin-associated surface protein (MASP) subgroup S073 [Trypanosoma cruzi]|uniref:Mucin-associated surface protein (MASP) subgroup S073 n=1 Tax=Trypanosoma cruzi TaxID=5693 RepID=A0A7J6XPV7_TRYCR|nr:Mucin-associated surface protein (MASP) subgroup S073 [Trypanosoma cruzi]
MAMMMTGRVLLVCALCVLWCWCGGFADEAGASAGGGNGLRHTSNGVNDGSSKADCGLFFTSMGLLKAVEAGDDNLPLTDKVSSEIKEVSDLVVSQKGVDGGPLAGAKEGNGAAGAVTSPPGPEVSEANEGERHLEVLGPKGDDELTRVSASGEASNSQNQTAHQPVLLSDSSDTLPGEVLPLSNSDSALIYKDPLKKGDVDSRDATVGDTQKVEELKEENKEEEELKEFKDRAESETRKEGKKEEGTPTKISTAQPTALERAQRPVVKLNGGKSPDAVPEGDASQTESEDAQALTHQQHESSSSQTETKSEAPEPPATDGVPPQQVQDTVTKDSMENATATNQAETTVSPNYTSGSGEAQSEADGNDAQRPNPNEPHDVLEGVDTNDAPTLSEAAPQTEETAAAARINGTATPGDSDSSTAVSHTTSPLLLLLLVVACAAAAAVVAA